jgi:6-phosphogluconolactonase (cycloisomerase 2 family)
VGSGLKLALCAPGVSGPHGTYIPGACHSELGVGANGAFTLDSAYSAGYSGGDFVTIAQQPSSPAQYCALNNSKVSIHNTNDTSVTVSCTKFSYVTSAADNTLSAYAVDATTGALTALPGFPVGAGDSPHAIVGLHYSRFDDKRYVFVGNGGSNDVSAFVVNSTTGALTAVAGSPFPAGIDPQAMAINDGSFELFVANAGSDNVSAYSIDPTTGALGAPSTIATGKSPTSIVLGAAVFVANHGGSNDISAFNTDQTSMPDGSIHINLTPVPGSPFPAGGNPLSLAVGAGGKFLYSANPDATNPSISGFSIDPDTGALSPLSGSPFPLPVSNYMATDQTGAYLYVTSDANVVGYGIDATTGALTALPGFPVSANANAYSITIDPTNQFLYVANDGAADVSAFRLDAATGSLTPITGSPFAAGNHPEFIATF